MAFDHKAYWADKMAKILRWGAFFDGVFGNEGFIALRASGKKRIQNHTRTIKERRMRRQVHQDRMRSRRAN